MTKVNFAEARQRAEAQGLLGAGSYLKLQEGDNRLRLMSECIEHPGEYGGKPTFKWLCYVLDRKDGKIKPFFMANTIYKLVEALQLNPDYAFDEVPMPYDITVNARGAGTKEVVYSVLPARNATPLTENEAHQLREIQPLRELQKAIYEVGADSGDKSTVPSTQPLPPVPAAPGPDPYASFPPEFRPSTSGINTQGSVGDGLRGSQEGTQIGMPR
jgi:hypothetical protein